MRKESSRERSEGASENKEMKRGGGVVGEKVGEGGGRGGEGERRWKEEDENG